MIYFLPRLATASISEAEYERPSCQSHAGERQRGRGWGLLGRGQEGSLQKADIALAEHPQVRWTGYLCVCLLNVGLYGVVFWVGMVL